MRKIVKTFLTIMLGGILFSCGSSIPRSDTAHETWAQNRWKNINLSHARAAYTANCAGCHSLHSPLEHTGSEWGVLFAEMASKAHMSAEDSTSVIAYLVTFSKDNNLSQK